MVENTERVRERKREGEREILDASVTLKPEGTKGEI